MCLLVAPPSAEASVAPLVNASDSRISSSSDNCSDDCEKDCDSYPFCVLYATEEMNWMKARKYCKERVKNKFWKEFLNDIFKYKLEILTVCKNKEMDLPAPISQQENDVYRTLIEKGPQY